MDAGASPVLLHWADLNSPTSLFPDKRFLGAGSTLATKKAVALFVEATLFSFPISADNN